VAALAEVAQTTASAAPTAIVVPIVAEADLIHVRQILRAAAEHAGLGLVDQTKLVTAGSELARNILTHATGSRGEVRVEQVRAQGRAGVRATFSDEGPGIEDLDAALTDGFSTKGSLGLGLPGSKRLVDELSISSTKGSPTTVVIVKWQR
jgi:serine/threonine-protein kinase RsbT